MAQYSLIRAAVWNLKNFKNVQAQKALPRASPAETLVVSTSLLPQQPFPHSYRFNKVLFAQERRDSQAVKESFSCFTRSWMFVLLFAAFQINKSSYLLVNLLKKPLHNTLFVPLMYTHSDELPCSQSPVQGLTEISFLYPETKQ